MPLRAHWHLGDDDVDTSHALSLSNSGLLTCDEFEQNVLRPYYLLSWVYGTDEKQTVLVYIYPCQHPRI